MAPSYLLCGYHIPASGDSKCLLYDDSTGAFKTKHLRQQAHRGFTSAFGPDELPPFRYTRVVDNVYSGGIKQSSQGAGLTDTVDTVPYTLLSEEDVATIFKDIPSIKHGVKAGVSLWTRMTEKEFVLDTMFKKDFLRTVRLGLIDFLGLRQSGGLLFLPSKLETLFIRFATVDFSAGFETYPDGPDAVVIRHKIIKHVLEEACPFIKVALFESLGLEIALSMCLPTGSTGRGSEIFTPRRPAVSACCYVLSGSLAIDGADFSIITDLTTGIPKVPVCSMPEDASYFDWRSIPYDDEPTAAKQPRKDKPAEFYHDIEGQLSLVGSVYKVGETDGFFSKGAVVFTTHDRTSRFACLDFSNFYASVVIKFNLDDYVVEVLKRMTALRGRFKELKAWIVTMLGQAKHLDPALFNRMKTLSVAVALSTINVNSGIVTGATTDGLLVDPDHIEGFKYPEGFDIKPEFVPAKDTPMISHGPNLYVGVSAETGKVVHRGFIGRRGNHPEWYRDLIDAILTGCLGLSSDTIGEIKKILASKASITKQYVLPDTLTTPQPTQNKLRAVEYYCNDLCAGICQVYAVVDEYVLPGSALTGGGEHTPPATQSALCVKKIDVQKYLSVIEEKIRRVATAFEDNPEATSLCETAFGVIKDHIVQTLPGTRAVYPGGVDYDY